MAKATTGSRVICTLLIAALTNPGCKPRGVSAVSAEGDAAATQLAPELKTLIEGEAVYQAALLALRPAQRTSLDDRSSLIHFDKLDSHIKPWWDKAQSGAPDAMMAGEVVRHLAAREIRLRYEMGFADARSYAREQLGKYFNRCTDYLGCTQMIAAMADFVQILPGPVLAHLTNAEPGATEVPGGWDPQRFNATFDAMPLLRDFKPPEADKELARIVRYTAKSLALTALFYQMTALEAPTMRGHPVRLQDDDQALLGLLTRSMIEEARSTWLAPTDAGRRTAHLTSSLRDVFARYFQEESARTGPDPLAGVSEDLREVLYLRATHVISGLVRVVQGVMSLELYLQRLLAPSTRDWVKLMESVEADTALFTYARYIRHESTLPGRAIYLEGMLRRMQGADVQKAQAVDEAGNVRLVPQPLHKTWAAQGDAFVAYTDMHVDMMLRDNLGVADLEDAEMRYRDCSRRDPGAKYGLPGRKLHVLVKCEEYLAARDRGFHSLLYMVEKMETAVDRFMRSQNAVIEEQERAKKEPALNRWAKSIADEFNPDEKLTQIQLQSSMMEFYNQLLTLNCYRLPLLKTLPASLELKLTGDPDSSKVDVIEACAPTAADKAKIADPAAELPRFASNVSNYLTKRQVDKIWKDFTIQASLLIANALMCVPIGWAAGAVTKGAAWAMGAIRAAQLAVRIGLPKFTFAAVRIVFEMTMFSLIHKASTMMVLWAAGADSDMIKAQAWDSHRSWWENLGESVAMGVAVVYLMPMAGNFANNVAGRLTGLRNSVHFAKAGLMRQIGFAAIAIPIENAAFPLPGIAMKLAEDALHGRLSEISVSDVAKGAAGDYLHSLPVSMVFRSWHGVGGHWSRGPMKTDLRDRLYKILNDTKVLKFAEFGYQRRLKGGQLTEAYHRELGKRVANARERVKELENLLEEYYMLQPEFMAEFPKESDRLAAVRRHIEVLRRDAPVERWMEEFADTPIRSAEPGAGGQPGTGFEGL